MINNANSTKPDVAKMEAALEAVDTALSNATDILHYENGQPVTALEGWQIEEIFNELRGVMVQVDEALAHKREYKPASSALPTKRPKTRPKFSP